ncbi:amidase [Bradyrhizobium sp. KB893862 SZCCT0404]|uniref:amidase n=1 Tax=Bradyrhizobium sp. KB893862 SZCCT0404 TaxID=2807672 RepID=UPI001BA448A9|nr:amidase [Bradyrhizobium sp. KB893862 SZCCT0404]MBR1177153.1 amidase [Bradyrhizobium sp. KB893862 SZCCT0404]
MTKSDELTRLSARQAVAALKKKELKPLELMDAVIERIEKIDGAVNALPVRFFDQARAAARAFSATDMERSPGWLAGLPFVAKEYNDVEGQLTTYGSPLFKDSRAAKTDVSVGVLSNAGGIVMAKSNVPEFAGANTFNSVYGATRNPWDLRMSAGGSSGGAAAALASGTAWLAMGSDVGGSLRIPASYCGIVGMRPTPGRVARGHGLLPFDPIWVEGPMARTVDDLALMLDAQSAQVLDDPLSQPAPAVSFSEQLKEPQKGARVAYSSNLGLAEVDKEVADITLAASKRLTEAGAEVSEDCPELVGAIDTFQTQRALLFATLRGELVRKERDRIPASIVWNVEKGLSLTADEVLRAERERARLVQNMRLFFGRYDFLVCPTVSVPPFPVEKAYPTEINGQAMTTYIDWMSMTFVITVTGNPAISVPCGFTRNGLPVGLQIVGRHHSEGRLLAIAAQLEQILGISPRLPVLPIAA